MSDRESPDFLDTDEARLAEVRLASEPVTELSPEEISAIESILKQIEAERTENGADGLKEKLLGVTRAVFSAHGGVTNNKADVGKKVLVSLDSINRSDMDYEDLSNDWYVVRVALLDDLMKGQPLTVERIKGREAAQGVGAPVAMTTQFGYLEIPNSYQKAEYSAYFDGQPVMPLSELMTEQEAATS